MSKRARKPKVGRPKGSKNSTPPREVVPLNFNVAPEIAAWVRSHKGYGRLLESIIAERKAAVEKFYDSLFRKGQAYAPNGVGYKVVKEYPDDVDTGWYVEVTYNGHRNYIYDLDAGGGDYFVSRDDLLTWCVSTCQSAPETFMELPEDFQARLDEALTFKGGRD